MHCFPFRFSLLFVVCQARVDLAFVIDGSGSIEKSGRGNFKRCLRFVSTLVASFSVSQKFTRVGVIVYSTRARLVLGFRKSRDAGRAISTIDKIRYPGGGTRTGAALRLARGRLFARRRSNRKRVLIVLTDGRSQDGVSRPSSALRRQGVELFAIGVGRRYNVRQLRTIASSRRHVFSSGFRNLRSIARIIKTKACRGGCACCTKSSQDAIVR